MGRLISLSILFCLLLVQADFSSAADIEIFGISNETNGIIGEPGQEVRNGILGSTLYMIDYQTGNAIPVGPVGYHECFGLDFHPITRQLYATCLGESHNPVLLDINPDTGQGTIITELQFQNQDFGTIADISFRNDGKLFGYVDSKIPFLAILNPDSGNIENVGPTNVTGGGNGIAFNDVLYHAQTDKLPTLYELNQTNGNATFKTGLNIPPPANDFPLIFSMDKDKVNNVFYGALDNAIMDAYTFYLVTVDVNTGQVGLIGETVEGLQALAVRSQATDVPTLSEYGMIGLAIVFLASALLVLRRRKQNVEA